MQQSTSSTLSFLTPQPSSDFSLSLAHQQSDIDSLRLKLVQLIEQVDTLSSQIHFASISTPEPSTSNPGIPPYSDLLARYNLLLSHLVGLSALLSSVGDKREPKRGETPDLKKHKWESLLVAPRQEVEESKDWLVGMLLRTKQTPEVESHLASLVSSLPAAFSNPETSAAAIKRHEALTESALQKINELKEGIDGEEWDWKGRVEVDEVQADGEEDGAREDADGDAVMGSNPVGGGGKAWTVQQVATFLRTGQMPNLT